MFLPLQQAYLNLVSILPEHLFHIFQEISEYALQTQLVHMAVNYKEKKALIQL